MTEHRRFMTYTQMEKAYRRIIARRTRQKRGKLLTPNREIADTSPTGKVRSDRLTPLRLMIIGVVRRLALNVISHTDSKGSPHEHV
jgi:hypothetical protein